jgi:flagellar assembly factor FliW
MTCQTTTCQATTCQTMTCQTAHWGPVTVDESSTIEFPEGLPGFEECRRFVPLQHPERAGLVFLQSLERTELCFLALPARAVRRDYELALSGEDTALLGFPEGVRPELGSEVLALAILCLAEGQPPTANLLAPVVIATRTRRAVQAIRPDQLYGCREPLEAEEAICS